jgi:hypothetical protein
LPIALSGKSLGDQSFKVHPKGFQGLVAAAGRRGFAEHILVEPSARNTSAGRAKTWPLKPR